MWGLATFLSITRFVHFVTILLFLPTLMILSFFPFVRVPLLISFSLCTCSLCLVNLSHSFFYSISSSPPLLGLSWMNRNSGHPPPPCPCCARPWSLRQMSTFNRQQRLRLCLICQPELSSTPARTVPSIPTLMLASMSWPSLAFVNHQFQQQRHQGGSSSSFPFRRTQSTESTASSVSTPSSQPSSVKD